MQLLSKVPFAADPHQDEYQFFRWMYVGMAHGFQSPEYIHALLEAEKHEPLGHYLRGAGYTDAQAAIDWSIKKLEIIKASKPAQPVRTTSQMKKAAAAAMSAATAPAPHSPVKASWAADRL